MWPTIVFAWYHRSSLSPLLAATFSVSSVTWNRVQAFSHVGDCRIFRPGPGDKTSSLLLFFPLPLFPSDPLLSNSSGVFLCMPLLIEPPIHKRVVFSVHEEAVQTSHGPTVVPWNLLKRGPRLSGLLLTG